MVLVIACVLMHASVAFGATDVSGQITGDQVWTPAGSPYTLQDNATVAAGASLTIRPGTRVSSSGGYRLNVVGRLTAVGTPADPIDISLGDGMRFYSGSSGSQLRWSTIRDSIGFGITNESGAPWPSTDHLHFDNNRFAIYPYYPEGGEADVDDSRFLGNDYSLSGVGGNFGIDRALIENSRLTTASLSNNTGQSWTLSNTNLAAPTFQTTCGSGQTGCTMTTVRGTYTATGLWWGTTDTAEINRRIYDGGDDPSRSTVAKDPIAAAPHDLYPPTSTPSGGPVKAGASGLTGTAADASMSASGVQQVTASIEDLAARRWWNGTAWVETESFLNTSGTTTWQLAAPPIEDGKSYRIRSVAVDSADNTQWGASAATVVGDGMAPQTTIDSGPSDATGSTAPSFGFSSSENGSTFECRLDGPGSTTGTWASCPQPTTYTQLQDGSYTFAVRATDPAGNTDSSEATRGFSVDTTPPATPAITSPASGSAGRSSSVNVTGTADPDSTIEVFDGQISQGTTTAGRTGEWSTMVSSLADGQHTLTAKARDGVDNTSPASGPKTITVDTTAPQTSIDSGSLGAISSPAASFAFSSSEANSSFECRLTGPSASGSWQRCSSPTSYTALGDGAYTFSVRATDPLGNTDASEATRAFSVGTTPVLVPPAPSFGNQPGSPNVFANPTIVIPRRSAVVTVNAAGTLTPKGLSVACPGPGATCTVRAAISSTSARASAAAKKRRVALGTTVIRVPAQTTRAVTLKLSRSGRRQLARKRQLKAQVAITNTRGSAVKKTSFGLTLKLRKRKR